MQLCFGNCRLNPESRRLFRDEREIHLTPKAFDLLTVLIDSRPRAVTKTELLQRVWPGTFVCDASLARLMTEIRIAVGDDARNPSVIRTVHAFGYAFAGAVTELERPVDRIGSRGTRCWIICGSRDFYLAGGENLIGRDAGVSVRLESPSVSRRHARIVISSSQAVLEDLGSKNSTYLRGERLAAPTQLEHGDEIVVGPFRMTFCVSVGSDPTETVG